MIIVRRKASVTRTNLMNDTKGDNGGGCDVITNKEINMGEEKNDSRGCLPIEKRERRRSKEQITRDGEGQRKIKDNEESIVHGKKKYERRENGPHIRTGRVFSNAPISSCRT